MPLMNIYEEKHIFSKRKKSTFPQCSFVRTNNMNREEKGGYTSREDKTGKEGAERRHKDELQKVRG